MKFFTQQKSLVTFFASALVGALLVAGCSSPPPFPEPGADDAGDLAFVRQVVPVLLGRKVRGYEELTALTDIVSLTSRETMIRALMEQDEFVEYWSNALVDQLRVAREGSKSQSGCYATPLLAGAVTPALADFVLDNVPSADFGSNFNMDDLVASSVEKDNLFPVYKAHVFPLVNRPGPLGAELVRRADLATSFEHIYLNRQQLCMQCHNSETSTSGEDSNWDRTHPVPGHFEAAIYGSSSGTSPEQSSAVFRTDARSGTLNPWGISTGCGTFKPSVIKDPENISAWFTQPLGRNVSVRNVSEILQSGYAQLDADGLSRSLPVAQQQQCEFCSTSCDGEAVADDAPLDAVNAAAVKTLLVDNCATSGCHAEGGGGGDSFDIPTDNTWYTDLVNVDATTAPGGGNQIRVVPGSAATSYLINKLTGMNIGGNQMPLGGTPFSASQIDTVENWINDIPSGAACNICDELDCDPPYPLQIGGHEAAAFLVAQRVVNNVWEQAMGYPLTIANYFSRTEGQLNILWNLTEYTFIPSDWSLKDLLVKILTSEYFNRNAPTNGSGTTPYNLEMVYDPFVETDPRVSPVSDVGYDPSVTPEVHNNAMSDGIYRYSANNLLNSIHNALDWPEPARFPSTTSYPDRDLQRAVGQYLSDASAGSKTTDFQSLLYWESVHGVCDSTGVVGSDWIDDVITEINGFAGGGGPLTLEDVTILFKDWFIADGTIATSAPDAVTDDEATALANYFGVPLTTTATTVSDLEDKLRGLCGVLVESPQFWLAGIVPTGLGPEPRVRVCNGGPCTYQEVCNDLKPSIDGMISGNLTCNSDSVSAALSLTSRTTLCPQGLCNSIPMDALNIQACLVNPAKCPDTPVCDPRCTRIDCCGGPLPPLDQQGLLVSWADGATTRQAEGVSIKRPGEYRFSTLKKGDTLREGDLLAMPPGSELELDSALGRLSTGRSDDRKAQDNRNSVTQLMVITGERAVAAPRTASGERLKPGVTPEVLAENYKELFTKHRKGAWRWGEAGRPLTPEQRRGYVGPEEAEGQKYIEQQLKLQEQGTNKMRPE
ncbi:MAG: hypothetical protein QNK31_06250 [Porticoccus sp.]|nr:hypothetical protein [Porticoccus sp.]